MKAQQRLKQRIQRVHLGRKPTPPPHDIRPHTSVAPSAAVAIRPEAVTRPLYSLDLALSDFWLFGALKKHLKGNCVTCDEEVQAAMVEWFQEWPD